MESDEQSRSAVTAARMQRPATIRLGYTICPAQRGPGPLQELERSIGKGSLQWNPLMALTAMFAFQERVLPMLGALFAEPELLDLYRQTMLERRKGPRGGIGRFKSYLGAEQLLGRIHKHVDPDMATQRLMASCFFQAFMSQFFRQGVAFPAFSKRLIASVLGGAKEL